MWSFAIIFSLLLQPMALMPLRCVQATGLDAETISQGCCGAAACCCGPTACGCNESDQNEPATPPIRNSSTEQSLLALLLITPAVLIQPIDAPVQRRGGLVGEHLSITAQEFRAILCIWLT